MRPYTSKVKPRKAAKTKRGKPIPPKGNPSSDAAKREKAAKTKRKPVVKKVAKKVVKATAKKTAVPIVTRGLIRAIPYIGAAVGAAALGVKALSEGFSRVTRGWEPQTKISKKTKRIQDLMVSAEERKKQTAQQRTGTGVRIHGGGLPYLGQQTDPGKSLRDLEEAKKAVSPLVLTGPVTAAKTTTKDEKKESPLGRQSGKPLKTRSERVDDYNYTPRKKSTTPEVVKKSTATKRPKSEVAVRINKSIGEALSPTKLYSKITGKGDSRPAAQKAPQSSMRKAQTDTSMGVYGWNNLTKSFGYLGTEKEVGKHGASTYFTKGFKRGSRVEGYKKRKSA